MQVSALSGTVIQSPAIGHYPPGWFSNGFFEWVGPTGLLDRRPIESHSGGTSYSVLGTTDGIKVGDWIVSYPGCNRATSDCTDKFNNLSNYGGIPHMPGKSPFSGDPVF